MIKAHIEYVYELTEEINTILKQERFNNAIIVAEELLERVKKINEIYHGGK